MRKPASGSTAPSLGTRSRTWPYEARTSKSLPRYFLMVLALAGDSTMTRFMGRGCSLARGRPGAFFRECREDRGAVKPRRRRGGGSVQGAGVAVIHELLHELEGALLVRLVHEHEQGDPLHVVDRQLVGVEGHRPLDHQLPAERVEDAVLLEVQQQALDLDVEP